jgi:hypothetical protein
LNDLTLNGVPVSPQPQPTIFSSGSSTNALKISVNKGDTVVWSLDGNTLSATTSGAPACH